MALPIAPTTEVTGKQAEDVLKHVDDNPRDKLEFKLSAALLQKLEEDER